MNAALPLYPSHITYPFGWVWTAVSPLRDCSAAMRLCGCVSRTTAVVVVPILPTQQDAQSRAQAAEEGSAQTQWSALSLCLPVCLGRLGRLGRVHTTCFETRTLSGLRLKVVTWHRATLWCRYASEVNLRGGGTKGSSASANGGDDGGADDVWNFEQLQREKAMLAEEVARLAQTCEAVRSEKNRLGRAVREKDKRIAYLHEEKDMLTQVRLTHVDPTVA